MDGRYNRSYSRYTDHQHEEFGEHVPNQRAPHSPPPTPPRRESRMAWLSRAVSSQQAQFAATALISGAVVAGAILGYQAVRRQEKIEDLKSSIPELGREHHAEEVRHSTRYEI